MESTANRLPCSTCRRRKVRCSKTQPCTNCARTGIDCHYEDQSNSSGDAGTVNADLMKRLVHLQNSIKILAEGSNGITQTRRDDPIEIEMTKPVNQGSFEGQPGLENIIKMMEDSIQGLHSANKREKQLSHTGKLCFRDAQARYIRETFWAGLYEEVSIVIFTGHSS